MDRKIVMLEVHWKDACSVDDWTERKNIDADCAAVVSVGILVKETADVLVLALNYCFDSDSFSCFISIPNKWIIRRNELGQKTGSRKSNRKFNFKLS